MSGPDHDDDATQDRRALDAPGVTDLPVRLSRALGEALHGPVRVLSSGLFGLARSSRELGLGDDGAPPLDAATGERLGRTGENLLRTAGGVVLESARVVDDTVDRFLFPHGLPSMEMVRPGNEFYPLAPYLIEDASIYACVIDASRDKLAAYLRKAFDEPSQGAVQLIPATNKLVLFIARNKKLRTANPKETIRRGYLEDDLDVALWALALRTNAPSLRGLIYFVPIYHFVKHAPSLAAGREVHGFPKQEASVATNAPAVRREAGTDNQTIAADKTLFGVSAWALKTNTTEEAIEKHRLLRVKTTREVTMTPSPSNDVIGFMREVLRKCRDSAALHEQLNGESIDGLLQRLGIDPVLLTGARGRIPMIFLRQVPDIEDSTRCVHQAIVESSLEITRLGTHGIVSEDTGFLHIDLPGAGNGQPFVTHRFDELGINFSAPELLPHLLWLNADIRLDDGKVLWSRP